MLLPKILIPNFTKKANLIGSIKLISFNGTKKSYYQLLEIEQTANDQQIRKSFLSKARKYHPDHNNSPQALQQFKSVKQAYQTLKDPQKRYMYDSGLSTQAKLEQDIYYSRKSGAAGRKYYENRWYGFQKSNYSDLRDDFYKSRQRKPSYDLYYQRITVVIAVLISVFGWDYLINRKTRASVQFEHNRNVLQSSIQPTQKEKKRIRKYIEARSKQHAV